MSDTLDLLNFIYLNAEMGLIGIEEILPYVDDNHLKRVIKEQERDYKAITNESISLLVANGHTEKEISPLAKISTDMMVKMSKKDTSTIAKMMMEGNYKGVIEITAKLNAFKEANMKAKMLANKLLKIEERNLENLKKFI